MFQSKKPAFRRVKVNKHTLCYRCQQPIMETRMFGLMRLALFTHAVEDGVWVVYHKPCFQQAVHGSTSQISDSIDNNA